MSVEAQYDAYTVGEAATDPLEAPDISLTRIGCVFGGVANDYARRWEHLLSDFTMARTRKTVSSALFMYFATFASTVRDLAYVTAGFKRCCTRWLSVL